jgi:hypothetical protein
MYHDSGQYPTSCLIFKAQRFEDWILSGIFPRLQVESTKLGPIDRAFGVVAGVRRQRVDLST